MQDPVFNGFALAGGTSLALQIGHRQSIDIDLFGNTDIDEPQVLSAYSSLGTVTKLKQVWPRGAHPTKKRKCN